MKNIFRKVLAALVLTLALTSSAFADDGFMHTDITPPSPPAADGFIHTGDAASTTEATDGIMWPDEANTLTEVGLSLLRDALSLI
jgi:hypothetical protein